MSVNTFLLRITLTSLVGLSISMVSTMPSLSQSNSSNRVTFSCRQIYDQASNKNIPATLAWVPERKENVRVIGWKSNYFDKTMSAEKRCEKVTQKFQTRYDNGEINYISLGKINGYPIICATKNENDPCDEKHQLFTLKSHSDPQEIQTRLSEILSGKASDMLMQSSGQQAYIPFNELLKSLPSVEN